MSTGSTARIQGFGGREVGSAKLDVAALAAANRKEEWAVGEAKRKRQAGEVPTASAPALVTVLTESGSDGAPGVTVEALVYALSAATVRKVGSLFAERFVKMGASLVLLREGSPKGKGSVPPGELGKAVEAVATFHELCDDLCSELVQGVPAPFASACGKGCSSCCSFKVTVLPPEAFAIAAFLKTSDPVALASLLVKLKGQAASAASQSEADYNQPCPFLTEERACGIYSVRPATCRTHFSVSRTACEQQRRAQPIGPLLEARQVALQGAEGLLAHYRLANDHLDLFQAVAVALETPEAFAVWASGGAIFPGESSTC